MDTQQLKALVAVAEHGSFSQAAASLYITQPAMSKRIAALEQQLKVKLFDRIGRKVQLSSAGLLLLPRALDILQAIDAASLAIANLTGEVAGKLTIATSHHIGLHRLAEVLRQYNRDYPQVELDIHFMDSEQGCNAVETGALELAVATLPVHTNAQLLTHAVWDDPLALVVAQSHALAQQPQTTWQALGKARAILPAKGTFTRNIIEAAMREQRVNLQVAMQTNYLQTIKMMVSIGLGWSALPIQMLKDAKLCQLHIEGVHIERKLGSVVHKNRSLSSAAKAFLEILHAAKQTR